MKRTIFVIAAVVFIALIGMEAFACYWDGYWSGPMGGPMAGAYGRDYQRFYEKTAKLRQDLAAKEGEYNALLATSDPDPKRAAELSREITVLQDQLNVQARAHNLPAPNAGYGRTGRYGCRW